MTATHCGVVPAPVATLAGASGVSAPVGPTANWLMELPPELATYTKPLSGVTAMPRGLAPVAPPVTVTPSAPPVPTTVCRTRSGPPAVVSSEAPGITRAVAAEYATVAPPLLVAVTRRRTYRPMSATAVAYEAVALPVPVASLHPVAPSSDTCH